MSRPLPPLSSTLGSTSESALQPARSAAPDVASHAPSLLSAADFDFALPEELIAQHPAAERDQSRLLVLGEHAIRHRTFAELPELLPSELGQAPLLVLNDTKVLPARLLARKRLADGALRRSEHDGGGRVELLLCDPLPPSGTQGQRWRAMSRASKPLRPGQSLELLAPRSDERADEPLVTVVENEGQGRVIVEFAAVDADGLHALLERVGEVPLPPYIQRERDAGTPSGSDPDRAADRERYQTVFAREPGSVAAPTAGLHFSPAVLAALESRGVERAHVTLHVGPGTFLPLRSDDLGAHVMHPERYHVPAATAARIAAAKAAGRPVLAVGTTVVRTLEAATAPGASAPQPGWGETRLFIHPPYRFRVVDALITNFHLPKSTLLMLVAALVGRRRVLRAYAEAIAARYRFYSFGDAMFIPRAMQDEDEAP